MTINELRACFEGLAAYPPDWTVCAEREAIFLEIGTFLENNIRPSASFDLEQNPNPVWELIYQRLEKAVSDAETYCPRSGESMLWQMYNSGVIIKNERTVMGMDLLPVLRSYGWSDPLSLTDRMAGLIDFLLITHRHGDHYDRQLVRACLEKGKTVCMPGNLATEWRGHSHVKAVHDETTFFLHEVKITARRAYHVWRDQQQELPLIYYEVTDHNNRTFLFPGDADYTKTFRKTPGKKIDLLFLPWRSPNRNYETGHQSQIGVPSDAVNIAIRRIEPAQILLEHYAELEHVYQGFPASYDMAVEIKKRVSVPLEWLAWGERINCLRKFVSFA